MKKDEAQLQGALARLETSVNEILKTRGYTKNAKSVKLLQELIREQLNPPTAALPDRKR